MTGPKLHILKKDNDWENSILDFITATIADALSEKDYCDICLSGGNTPKRIYELLAESGTRRGIEWDTIRLFWGDERAVPYDHEDSNYKMVKEALLDHIDIPVDQIFPFPTPEHPESAANAYSIQLQTEFGADGNTFDLTLLGLGDDGHTASIFPHTPLVTEKQTWVKEVWLKQTDSYRISLTAPVINRSRRIAFLVKGAGKAKALYEVLQGEDQPEEYPAQLIRKVPEVHYFLDDQAAEKL